MGTLNKAIAIASEAFKNKNDKGGRPYILHCIRVMQKVEHKGDLYMICAVLHDVIEDCKNDGYDFDFLRKEGFSQEVLTILELLTHRDGTDYMDYIKALSVHDVAKKVKLADLEDNSQITRLKGMRKKDFDRIEKYFRAYTYLKD